MKNNIVFFIFILISGSYCPMKSIAQTQKVNAISEKEASEGWELLFDGKDLKGWHSYLQKNVTPNWSVKNNAIAVKVNSNNREPDLVTDETFDNFDLKLQWRMNACSNSGVIFYVQEDPKYKDTYQTGPEMQITDFACLYTSDKREISDSRIHLHRAGALYGLVPVDTEWVNPAPQWNEYEIKAFNGHIELYVNGHKVVDTQLWDYPWLKLVSRSKFKQWPDFGTFRSGHISLQGNEDGELWFRNIKIKKYKLGPVS